jgi:hypothetical protein
MHDVNQKKEFALASATKGLSDRPLETFGCHHLANSCPYANSVTPTGFSEQLFHTRFIAMRLTNEACKLGKMMRCVILPN